MRNRPEKYETAAQLSEEAKAFIILAGRVKQLTEQHRDNRAYHQQNNSPAMSNH